MVKRTPPSLTEVATRKPVILARKTVEFRSKWNPLILRAGEEEEAC